AAESRYREALYYQDNNAPAMFGLAATLEKEGRRDEAVQLYTQYLKTLPGGPRAEESKKALTRLGAPIPEISPADAQNKKEQQHTELYDNPGGLKKRVKDQVTGQWCVNVAGTRCTHPKDAKDDKGDSQPPEQKPPEQKQPDPKSD